MKIREMTEDEVEDAVKKVMLYGDCSYEEARRLFLESEHEIRIATQAALDAAGDRPIRGIIIDLKT